MSKRNYINYDYNYRESLMNQIKVNKRADLPQNILKLLNNNINYYNTNLKDNLYYSIERNAKTQKNKIPLSLNKKNMKKVTEEKAKNSIKNTLKKTINTYSNENRTKDGNIFEELQNNKYLRPMLCTSNINNKLLKCQIEEPIQNICTLSLKKYINHNIEIPFAKIKSPEKNNNNEISDENTINYYNLDNKSSNNTVLKKTNNFFSPNNEILYLGDKNTNNSFVDKDNSFKIIKYLSRYSINNMKKYSASLECKTKKIFIVKKEKK